MSWDGLKPKKEARLLSEVEVELCQISIRTEIAEGLKDLSAANFAGAVVGRAHSLIASRLENGRLKSFPKQQDLAFAFELKKPATSKFLSGAGSKKGNKIDWLRVGREMLSYLLAGKREPADLQEGSVASRIDRYFFRGGERPAIWEEMRRGSPDCWTWTELAGEIDRFATLKRLNPGSDAELWYTSGGPSFFSSRGDDPLSFALRNAEEVGITPYFTFPEVKGHLDAEASLKTYAERTNCKPAYLPLPANRLTANACFGPLARYLWLQSSSMKALWIIRADLNGVPDRLHRERPVALRGRDLEVAAFGKWIKELQALPAQVSRRDRRRNSKDQENDSDTSKAGT